MRESNGRVERSWRDEVAIGVNQFRNRGFLGSTGAADARNIELDIFLQDRDNEIAVAINPLHERR